MPTIIQLSPTPISTGDQIPFFSLQNGDARRVPVSALLSYFQQQFAAPTMAVNLFVPSTGFSIAVPTPVSEQQWMLLQPVSTLATGTIVLPLNTSTPDGTEVLLTSTQTITSLTVSLNGAANAFGAPTTLSAEGFARMRFYQATNSWYRIA